MLTYWSGIQETRKPYKEGRDELLDTWHTLLIPKVVAALLPEKETEQMRQMKQLSEWLSTSLCFTPGTLGGIKVDGTAFHHGGFYPGYTTGALGAVGSYIGFTLDTPYQISPTGRKVFRTALEGMRNYCNLQEWSPALGDAIRSVEEWRNQTSKHLPNLHWLKSLKEKNLTHNWLQIIFACKQLLLHRESSFVQKDVNQLRIRKASLFSIMVLPESIVTNNT